MRSSVAKRIQAETPNGTRILVRQYADAIVQAHELPGKKEYAQKNIAGKPRGEISGINKKRKGNDKEA